MQRHLISRKYSSSETSRNPFPTFEEYLGSSYKIYTHERRAPLNEIKLLLITVFIKAGQSTLK